MTYRADVTGDRIPETIVRTPTNEFLLNGKLWADHGGPNLGKSMAQFADVTGDGKADLIYQGPDNKFWVSISKGTTSALPKEWFKHGGKYTDGGRASYADYNGDKVADLAFVGVDGSVWLAYSNRSTAFTSVFRFGDNYQADVTGDGKPEDIFRTPTNEFWLNGKIWTDHGGPNLGRGMAKFADVTGDKKADLIYQTSENAFYVSVSKGTTSATPTQWFKHGGTFRDGSETSFADRNGDKLNDLVFRSPDGSVWVAFSNGKNQFVNVKQVTLPPAPPPPPRRHWGQDTGHRVYFTSPGESADAVIQQDLLVEWNNQANYGYPCYEPVNKLYWSYPNVSVEVHSELNGRTQKFTAPAYAGGKPGHGRLIIPAYALAPGVNLLKLRCEGISLVQNMIGVYGVNGPRNTSPPQRTYFNPSTSNKNAGLPFIVSYDTRNGLVWHPGDYCSHPDYTKRSAQTWDLLQYDHRSGYVVPGVPSPIWSVSLLYEGYQIKLSEVYRTKNFRYSPQVLHYPGACATRTGSLTLALVCNGWTQDSIHIPCSQWVDQ